MGEIFSMFFDLFISLWGNIEAIFMPIINFIMWLAPLIVDVILNILEFIFGAIGGIIEGIVSIFEFFGVDYDFGNFGGGGFGGGGGGGR